MKPLVFPIAAGCSTLALLALLAFSQSIPQDNVTRLAEIILPAASPAGHKIDELSGLAWNSQSQTLHAVSDDGYLFGFQLQQAAGEAPKIDTISSVKLSQTLSKSRNAESVALSDVGGSPSLLVAYEDTGKVISMNMDGKAHELVAEIPTPDKNSNDNDGVEAIAVLSAGRLAYITEKPLEDTLQDVNVIHIKAPGGNTEEIRFNRTEGENWRIKALDILPDGRLLVLQRSKLKEADRYRNQLVVVENCSPDPIKLCASNTLKNSESTLGNSALEAMTVLDNGTVALADDVKSADGQSRLLLFKLQNL